MRRIVADVIASLEKNAVFQTEGEPDGRPYLKTRPLSEILDEIESRISPEIRELEVRDGEIVRKEPGRGDLLTENRTALPTGLAWTGGWLRPPRSTTLLT